MPLFSVTAQKALSRNPNVQKVSKTQILFTGAFKIRAVKLNLSGKSPVDIFVENEIDPVLFLDDYPKKRCPAGVRFTKNSERKVFLKSVEGKRSINTWI